MSGKMSVEYAASMLEMNGPPKQGEFCKHYNGNVYVILGVTDWNEGHPVMVIYQGPNAKYWTNPLDTWYQSMAFHDMVAEDQVEFYGSIVHAQELAKARASFESREKKFLKDLAELCNDHNVCLSTDHTESIWVDDNMGGERVNEGNVL